ncbi:MAG: phosphoenolpyruvate synthase [Candidatus Kapaibacterium sp.]
MSEERFVLAFDEINAKDTSKVGGKNSSLGEMISKLKSGGVKVPGGFATTAHAYRQVLKQNDIQEKIKDNIDKLHKKEKNLQETGRSLRRLFTNIDFSDEFRLAVKDAYEDLCREYGAEDVDVAVRSSATAEDLPEASFAGQQETFLNVSGIDEIMDSIRQCFASLFTDRAISYREENGFDHLKVALSAGVQKMVRSDKACSGVMFSIDTETGFRDSMIIDSTWGLGENVVQGSVNPDEFMVFKPLLDKKEFSPIIKKELGDKEKKMIYSGRGKGNTRNIDTSKKERRSFTLSDNEILKLAKWGVEIEKYYEKPMDMEWAKDGIDNEIYIVQARPETVQSQKTAESLKSYSLDEKGEILIEGIAIGEAIASGKAQIIKSSDEIDRFEDGSILITGMTDPDWVPIMKKAAGIITDHGGRTSHAAIVSRELGIPAVIGTDEATDTIDDGMEITLSCAEGDKGRIYKGLLEYSASDVDLSKIPGTKTEIMMNIASPSAAFRWWKLPTDGIGLARMEFIINNIIKIHPNALIDYNKLEDKEVKKQIRELTAAYRDKEEYFIDNLSQGIARIAASVYPKDVIVRMSDFKSNEYADLIGGEAYEPDEENPMLGFRGASRYYSDDYREGFALECAAIKRARELIGLDNVVVMIPFCRTLDEADNVLKTMSEYGLTRGEKGLRVYVMAEIPSNIILAEEYADRFDGFSIGTNDLTQLVLGVDRDSEKLSDLFDERDPAVKKSIAELIEKAHRKNTKVGICGQAPSDHEDFAAFLVEQGIDSISLNPDTLVSVKKRVSREESRR